MLMVSRNLNRSFEQKNVSSFWGLWVGHSNTEADMSNSYDLIYAVVRHIPYGHIATYGQIAELAGLMGKPRVVGYALYRVTDADEIPWHRVINAKGEVSRSPHRNGTDDLQRSLLESEGIQFDRDGRINLSEYRWIANSALLEAAIAQIQHQTDNEPDSSS